VAGGGDGPGGGDRADAGAAARAAGGSADPGPVTIDLDTTDVEVYGRKKRGVAYNYQGQRVGRSAGVPEEARVRLFAVYADAVRRVAKAEVEFYEANIVEHLRAGGMTDREQIEFSTVFGNRVSAALEKALVMVYRRHRIHAWTEHSVHHVEAAPETEGIEGHIPQPPAICFVDLTGYTRLTEERGDRFAADAPAQLAPSSSTSPAAGAATRSGGWATEGCSTSETRPTPWTPAWTWSSRLWR
jgi:hypothetical protein